MLPAEVSYPQDAEVQVAMVDTRGGGQITALATVVAAVVAVLAFLYGDNLLCRLGSDSGSSLFQVGYSE